MSGALRELIAFFGVEVDDKQIDKAGEKLEGFTRLLEKVGTTLGLAFGVHEIAEFVEGQIQMAVEIGHTSEMLGLGTEELQAFQYAAANAGLSAEEATTGLRFLNKNMGEAALKGGDAAETFRKLGVHLKENGQLRSTQDVFADLADGISKLPTVGEKTAKAMELFGRSGARLIPLLNKGSKGIEEFYEEFEKLGGGLSEDYIKAAEDAHHETLKLGVAWKGVKATVGAALIPAFSWLVDKLGAAVTWFREFSKHSYIMKTALATLGVVVGALVVVWGILNFEVLLVVLALALLVLVVDDVYTAFMGGKSVIGDFIDSIFGIGATKAIVESISTAAKQLWADLGTLWESTKKLVEAFQGVSTEGDTTKTSIWNISAAIQKLTDDLSITIKVITFFVDLLTKATNAWGEFKKAHPNIAKVVDDGASMAEATSSFNPFALANKVNSTAIDLFKGDISSFLPPSIAPDQIVPPVPINSSSTGPTSVTNQTTVSVDVNASGNPREVGNEVAAGVRRGLDQSDLNSSYAGMAGNGGY